MGWKYLVMVHPWLARWLYLLFHLIYTFLKLNLNHRQIISMLHEAVRLRIAGNFRKLFQNSYVKLCVTRPAPAVSLAENDDIIKFHLSYNFPSTLLGVKPLQNIKLGCDIVWIIIGITELFNYQLVMKILVLIWITWIYIYLSHQRIDHKRAVESKWHLVCHV